MSEEQQHPQEPAEGGVEEVEAQGADRPNSGEGTTEKAGDRSSTHPREPAEGGDEDVGAQGADRAGEEGS